MKKTTLTILAIFIIALSSTAQTKFAPADTVKKHYTRFFKVLEGDFMNVASNLDAYKRLVMYDPMTTDEQKVALFKGVEAYQKRLPEKVKIDSTLDAATPIAPIKK